MSGMKRFGVGMKRSGLKEGLDHLSFQAAGISGEGKEDSGKCIVMGKGGEYFNVISLSLSLSLTLHAVLGAEPFFSLFTKVLLCLGADDDVAVIRQQSILTLLNDL